MKPCIAVVDYEMGNLHSVSKALEKAGGRVQVTSSPEAIRRADAVVLPGVGAFGEAVKRLAAKKLAATITDALEKNKPFLGICLGLQLLFERSEENPKQRGLGIFKGDVVRFKNVIPRGRKRVPFLYKYRRSGRLTIRRDDIRNRLKVPHMGWNTIQRGPAGGTPLLKGISAGEYFYFVHSFFPAPRQKSLVATHTVYGRPFCSSIAKDRLFASQFHPEKSGDQGQRILRNFVREVAAC